MCKSRPVNSAGGEEFLTLTWCKVCGWSWVLRNRYVGESSTHARGAGFHQELEQSGKWYTEPAKSLKFYRTVWAWQNKTWFCLRWNDFQKRKSSIGFCRDLTNPYTFLKEGNLSFPGFSTEVSGGHCGTITAQLSRISGSDEGMAYFV